MWTFAAQHKMEQGSSSGTTRVGIPSTAVQVVYRSSVLLLSTLSREEFLPQMLLANQSVEAQVGRLRIRA